MFGRVMARAVRDPGWDKWAKGDDYGPGGSISSTVNGRSATQLMTVYGCVTLISDVMSTMPVDHFTRSGGKRTEVTARAPWLDRPNPDHLWSSFMSQVMWSWLIDGNVFLVPIRSAQGRVLELYVLDPTAVQVDRAAGGDARYTVAGRVFTGEMVHLRAYVRPGELRGINPIENARTALGWGMAAQEFGRSFLENSAVPPAVITTPGTLSTEQKKDLRDAWSMRHGGPRNAGKVGLLEGGGDIKQLSMSMKDTQFLESRRFSASEIASNLFHVPSVFVGVAIEGTGSLTYTTLADKWTDLIRQACMSWMVRFEEAVSWHLLPRPQYIKFNADVYMRPDTKTRYETHAIGIDAGFLLVDQVREFEDWESLGDNAPSAPVDQGVQP